MNHRLIIVLLCLAIVPVPCFSEVTKSGDTNLYVDEAKNPGSYGVEALVDKWVTGCGSMTHQNIIKYRNVNGIVPLDFLEGLAYLNRISHPVGNRLEVIEILKAIVANEKRVEIQRDVAVIGLIYLSDDAQSIDLCLDHLLSRVRTDGSDRNCLEFLTEQCVLTIAQSDRVKKFLSTPPTLK